MRLTALRPSILLHRQKPFTHTIRIKQTRQAQASSAGERSFPPQSSQKREYTTITDPTYQNTSSGFKSFTHSHPFPCTNGSTLESGYTLSYETWGSLNETRSNAILLHSGLSASSHAKSHPENLANGWWENFIGGNLAIDTNKYFVICANVLGGCYGSTGPLSINPATRTPYALTFPLLSIADIVASQFHLLDSLNIKKLYASVGSSMGGMTSLASAAMFPSRVGRLVSISAAARSHPYSIALRHAQRQVLISDPKWNGGNYYGTPGPIDGLKLSRMIATVSYRSGPEWESRFGRRRISKGTLPISPISSDYLIESYLDHQGDKWSREFDANSFLYLSRAMDTFDVSQRFGWAATHKSSTISRGKEDDGVVRGLSSIDMPVLVLGVQSDILFPVWQQKEYAAGIRQTGNDRVVYYEMGGVYGHDTFLIDDIGVGGAVKGFLEGKL